MKKQLTVRKADGLTEDYFHTKVFGTISKALGRVGQADVYASEQLADAVTYFLYHKQTHGPVPSREILSVIKAVLSETEYEKAALVLEEHYYQRKLKRSRIEVVCVDAPESSDARSFGRAQESARKNLWDKSRIVEDLVVGQEICRQTARTIASMVEEKVLGMNVRLVSAGLLRQLVLADAAALLRAQEQLQTA